jgi:hypothetical protein
MLSPIIIRPAGLMQDKIEEKKFPIYYGIIEYFSSFVKIPL